jgi:HPt (histidine-containing phosphotransfer) domain-containing protein
MTMDTHYNIQHLLELTNNDNEFVRELTEIFCETIPPLADELYEACKESNWVAVSQLAHKLKPTIDTMRIESIREDIFAIETKTKQNIELNTIPELVEKVYSVIHLTRDQLKTTFLQ